MMVMQVKKFLFTLFLIVGGLLIYLNRTEIVRIIVNEVVKFQEVSLEYKNSYYLRYNFKYVNSVDSFNIRSKQDLLDLYYTIINNGNDTFDFYCPSEYKNCIDDVKLLANNPKELSNINGFVHPYNSFDIIETKYDSLNRVTLNIVKTYDDETIALLNKKIEEIVETEIKDEKNARKIIKIVHDYIIKHTKYDKDRTDKNIIKYQSNTAYGVLFEGYGICSGYSDAMALFLNYFNIPNFKVTSENHVWYAVFIDGKWLHLDLTWDDPILSSGEDVLDDSYFLITTSELNKLSDSQHHFDENIYVELMEN